MMSDMRLSCRDSHHRALAGGTSTSQLQSWGKQFGTPPGFSRWYFNFTTTKLGKTVGTPPGFSRWYFNFTTTKLGKTVGTPPGFSRFYERDCQAQTSTN